MRAQIIDADVHVSPTPQGGNSIRVEELLRRMDRAGVAKALTWLQPPYTRAVEESNAYVHRCTKEHPDRILGFGWVDPNPGVERAIAEVRRCTEEYGFLGVKLNGAQNNFYIDDPALSLPVIEAVAATGKVLAFHVGTDAYDQTHPYRVAKIARRYPDLRILMVHMGGVAHHDISSAAIEFAREHPNLTLIGSGVRSVHILKAIQTLGPSRVCFGSDMPFELMRVEVAKYRALLDGELTEAEQQQVMGGNLARLLGIPV